MKLVLAVSLTIISVFSNCYAAQAGETRESVTHGYVGLRPLPRYARDLRSNHGGSWAGLPVFADQKGNYPFVAENVDIVMGWLDGDFKTKRLFFEYYWGLSKERDDLDPDRNGLIKTIQEWESKGGEVVHILICREARLAVNRGYPDAELGPFKEDGRILSAKDVTDIRTLFQNAHQRNLIQHDNYNLIQMVEEPSFFMESREAQAVIDRMEGVAYEAHQFNRHWPLETGWSKPEKVVRGAQWTLAQGKEYIFYYGPVIWKPDPYYHAFIERDWLHKYWEVGLPKHHPHMHYYLNTFPHGNGRGRPVGPETDPHSVLGLTKWLIQEIKPETSSGGVRPRFAYSADGYNQDRDDVAASAMAIALFDRAGMAEQLVHFHFNTNFGGKPRPAREHRRSVLQTAVLFGMIEQEDGEDGFFDVSRSEGERQAAIAHLADQFLKSSTEEPLVMICAGGAQIPYLAMAKAIRDGAGLEVLQHMTFLSHSRANQQACRKTSENPDYRNNWDDLKTLAPQCRFVDFTSPLVNGRRDGGLNPSQNSTAWSQSPRQKKPGAAAWQWLSTYGGHVEGFGFSGTKGQWLLERLKAAGAPEIGPNGNAEGDASDAGMVFGYVLGRQTDATMEDIKGFFLDGSVLERSNRGRHS